MNVFKYYVDTVTIANKIVSVIVVGKITNVLWLWYEVNPLRRVMSDKKFYIISNDTFFSLL